MNIDALARGVRCDVACVKVQPGEAHSRRKAVLDGRHCLAVSLDKVRVRYAA